MRRLLVVLVLGSIMACGDGPTNGGERGPQGGPVPAQKGTLTLKIRKA